MTSDDATVDPGVWQAFESRATQGPEEARVAVLVQLVPPARVAERSGDPSARLTTLERETEELQRDLLGHLDRLGVTSPPRTLTLANAVAVELTAEQIRSVAQRPDVRRIVPAEPKHVAT
ncbi:hypothetical protein ACQP04_29625 [Pseudonocardia halophobica]|uniref:hypothetical protein n=1 Tax=Pseudonocardia halophobica TaxID=29401 RepID=UPI003D8FADE3